MKKSICNLCCELAVEFFPYAHFSDFSDAKDSRFRDCYIQFHHQVKCGEEDEFDLCARCFAAGLRKMADELDPVPEVAKP